MVKRVPGFWWLVALISFSGIAEGFGISMLLPVASSLVGDLSEESLPWIFKALPVGLEAVGIKPTFGIMLLIVLTAMSLSFLLIHVQDRAIFKARYAFLEKLRNNAVHTLFSAQWERISSLSSGSTTNKIVLEADRGSEAIIALLNIIATLLQIFVYLFIAILLSWKMSLVAFFIIVIGIILPHRIIKRGLVLGRFSAKINSQYSHQLVDYIRGAKILKALGAFPWAEANLRKANHLASDTLRKIVVGQSLMRFELQLLTGIMLVIILYVAVEVFNVQAPVLLVFLFIFMRLAPKFSTLQGQHHSYVTHRASLDVADDLILENQAMLELATPAGGHFHSITKYLQLKGVGYRHPGAKINTIKNINIKINKGDFVAFVGASGGGKSTILSLLMGLIAPTTGHVIVDDVNLSKLDLIAYRDRIGFVSQDSVIFQGTIRENLCLGKEYDDSHIWHCLKIAQIDNFVRDLLGQLDYQVEEDGGNISGGQKQRLAIARALIRRPTLLVLDEATSALDRESEAQLQLALGAIAHEYTVAVAAHRLETVRKATIIYVLDNGNVVQSGDYDFLVDADGPFAQLVKMHAITQ